MNAAMVLYAAGKCESLSAGYLMARSAVEEGAAARKLDELVQEPVAAAKV
jgi:anthranilate phosphoribosyltransferase